MGSVSVVPSPPCVSLATNVTTAMVELFTLLKSEVDLKKVRAAEEEKKKKDAARKKADEAANAEMASMMAMLGR